LTREAIFEAIKNRNVYATSGERIVLGFRLNGICMGGETRMDSPGDIRTLEVAVCGTKTLEAVEIVRNGEVIRTERPGSLDLHLAHEDSTPIKGGTYYYVRVTQSDGGQAWSSPIWVDLG
jgi:hypothetical protein